MERVAISSRGRLQRVPSAIRVEVVRKNTQDNNKKTGRSNRTVILMDLAPPRRSVLEVGIRRVVDWSMSLFRVETSGEGWRPSEDDRNRRTSTQG